MPRRQPLTRLMLLLLLVGVLAVVFVYITLDTAGRYLLFCGVLGVLSSGIINKGGLV